MSILYAESIKSIFRTLGHHLHNLGGHVEQGLEGVHHVGTIEAIGKYQLISVRGMGTSQHARRLKFGIQLYFYQTI